MAYVRQVPGLPIRGSLANITMVGLTEEQQAHVGQLTEHIANHPDMRKHKERVRKQFAIIFRDYRDDKAAADEEYLIAIWRGVVDLFYHRSYTFQCKACKSSTFTTKRGSVKPIDRVQIPCPNCHKVEVVEAGDTNLKVGRMITHEAFQDSYEHFNDARKQPKCKSTIHSTPGKAKYQDPQKIIDDPRQLEKFFGEFVWNYFRQHQVENRRKSHQKPPQKVIDRADRIIVEELKNLCYRLEIQYNYFEKNEPQDGFYHIYLFGLLTPPEFSVGFATLRQRAKECGVSVQLEPTCIKVKVNPRAKDLETYLSKPEHVNVLDNCVSIKTSSTDETGDNDYTVAQTSYRTVGGNRMDLDDHEEVVDSREVLNAIRDALPDGHCRDVFDIHTGTGNIYDQFSRSYGDHEPRVNHIADFLGITPRTVNAHRDTIRNMCVAKNLIPS